MTVPASRTRPRRIARTLAPLLALWPAWAQAFEPPAGETAPAESAAAPEAQRDWIVRLDVRGWYVAPAGELTLPSSGPAGNAVKLSTLDADSPRFSPYGELSVQADRLLFTLAGANFSADRSTTATSAFRLGDVEITPGDTVRTDLDFTLAQASVGYRVFDHDFDAAGDNRIRIWALGGVRLQDLSFDVSEPGVNRTRRDVFTGEPFVGVRTEGRLARDFYADLDLSVGAWPGSRSTFSFDVAVAFSWRPVSWFGAQVGYRLLITDTETGDGPGRFRFDGSMAGLFAGVTLRF